jgi:hypothetical protein
MSSEDFFKHYISKLKYLVDKSKKKTILIDSLMLNGLTLESVFGNWDSKYFEEKFNNAHEVLLSVKPLLVYLVHDSLSDSWATTKRHRGEEWASVIYKEFKLDERSVIDFLEKVRFKADHSFDNVTFPKLKIDISKHNWDEVYQAILDEIS